MCNNPNVSLLDSDWGGWRAPCWPGTVPFPMECVTMKYKPQLLLTSLLLTPREEQTPKKTKYSS